MTTGGSTIRGEERQDLILKINRIGMTSVSYRKTRVDRIYRGMRATHTDCKNQKEVNKAETHIIKVKDYSGTVRNRAKARYAVSCLSLILWSNFDENQHERMLII